MASPSLSREFIHLENNNPKMFPRLDRSNPVHSVSVTILSVKDLLIKPDKLAGEC